MEYNSSHITVGGKRFHYIWLRDNCLTRECRHPTSFQKIYDISELTETPKPLNVELTNDELIIDWDEKPPHRSIFPLPWLMIHAYDETGGISDFHIKNELRKQQEILWDSAWIEAHTPEKHDFHTSDRQAWVNQLYALGFAVIKNMPLAELDNFISSIGPIHYTEGGRIFTVKSKLGANDIADTDYALPPHNPDYFQILVETPAQFQQFYTEWEYYHRRSRQIIELDPKGQVIGVYFGHSHAYNWNIPFDKMENFYAAYSAFFRYLKSPDYQYRFRLEAGDCLMVQNFRVLHGRTAFDASSGPRHLEVAFVAWDYFTGKENFQQFKHLYLI